MEYRFVGPGLQGSQNFHWRTVMVLLMATVVIADYPPVYPEQPKVAFACENSYAYLNCIGPGEKIRIMRANYGRFSLVVCNQDGIHSGWDLQCASERSTHVVGYHCDGYKNCTFIASNQLFGDPCSGTKKYIEVRYICEKDRTTPPSTSSSSTTVSTTSTSTSTGTSSTSEPSTNATAVTTVRSTSIPPPTTTRRPEITRRPSLSTTVRQTTLSRQHSCNSRNVDGLQWPVVSAGEIAELDCPDGKDGVALWKCGEKGWIGKPDLSNCVSLWMTKIKESMEKDVEVAVLDLNLKIKSKQLEVGDLKAATNDLLPSLVKKMKKQVKPGSSIHWKKKIQTFTKEMVKTGSELLDNKQKDSWKKLAASDRKKSATSLIISMEEMALEVASTVDTPSTVTSTEENILMEVSLVQLEGQHQNLRLPSQTYQDSVWTNTKDAVVLPIDGLPNIDRKRDVSITFLLYQNLEKLMSPEDGSLDAQTEPDSNWVVNTNIISASVNGLSVRSAARGQQSRRVNLERPMNFILDHKMVYEKYRPACAFWDFDESDLTGHWSQEGCSVVQSNPTQTVCQCDHLTNFAVLMDISGNELSRHHELSLTAITYVGCTVSIICLFISFVSFSIFRNLQSDRNTIHKNLVLCLMVAEILFVFGIAQTENKIVCSVIAGFLHFFFLTSFAWMCLEGIQLYFMLIEVFEAERSRVRWFYLFGYGMPALIVGISAAADHTGYGTDQHCWLRSDNYFILSFIVPAAIVIMINIVMLGIAVYMMCRHANVTATAIRSREKGRLEKLGDQRPLSKASVVSEMDTKMHLELPTWLKGSAVLVVLLGLTWTFGFMYVNADSLFMAYIFTILNSLQGLFIFIFHCFMDRKVKKEYRKMLQRSSWIPNVIRVNCGGYTGNMSSPTPTSSTGQNWYFFRFWSSRKRKRSSGSLGSGKSRNQRSDLDSFLRDSSSGCTTTGTGVNRYSNQSDKLIQNDYSKLPTCYEDGVKGDLSVVDCSVVDSEFVSTYCQENLQVSKEKHDYSSGSEDEMDPVMDNISQGSLSKNRLSFLSQDSALKIQSDFASSDNEEGVISQSDLSYHDYQGPKGKESQSHVVKSDKSDSETNLLNNLLNFVHQEKTYTGTNGKVLFPSLNGLDSTRVEPARENTIKSAPDLKSSSHSTGQFQNGGMNASSQPLLGSLPDLSSISEEDQDTDSSDHCPQSARLMSKKQDVC